MTQPLIRHAEPSDYRPVIAVVDEWWGGRRMANMLPKLFFVHFRNTSFVAEYNDQLVGFVIGFVSQTFLTEAYIHFVGVHPEFRKGGLARMLYEKFFAAVETLGCRTVRCVTSPVNKGSISFHHPIVEDYDGEGEDRVLFSKNLNDMRIERHA